MRTTPAATPDLVWALAELSDLDYRLGEWPAAYLSAVEALRAATFARLDREAMSVLPRLAMVEGSLGREDACRRHAARAIELSRLHPSATVEALACEALGRLELGLGRIEAAIDRLQTAGNICAAHPGARAVALTWAEDLADACIRRGDRVGAQRAVKELDEQASRSGSRVLVAALTRSRAMLAPEDRFDELFEQALDWAACARQPFDRARTELSFGERLRRARRRQEARGLLTGALGTFEALGSAPWAERAHQELVATGIRARRRLDSTRDDLTATEEHVAQVVAGGATNREAAAQLFVTEKTIETHLSRIYRKLGLRSRTQLARAVQPVAAAVSI
jgi:DNA-binding CsgD family transcriptional regulator